MSVLDTLRENQQSKREKAREQLRKVARRIANGNGRQQDQTTIENNLPGAGWTYDDFEQLVKLLQRADELGEQAKQVDELRQQARTKEGEAQQSYSEAQRLYDYYTAQGHELHRESRRLQREADQADTAARELQELREDHPEALGAEAVDFDRLKLTNGGGELDSCDKAERYEVSFNRFVYEKEKRRALRVLAWQEVCDSRSCPSWDELVGDKKWLQRQYTKLQQRLGDNPDAEALSDLSHETTELIRRERWMTAPKR
jgi:predicted translin family RNA/ssDNA-binding protein